jgi:hypothetical protein
MKIIKFNLSNGESINLPFEQAEKVLDSKSQLIKILDVNGIWTGKTINQAHIVSTVINEEVSNFEENPVYNSLQLKSQDEKERLISIQKTLQIKRKELEDKRIIRGGV